MIRKVFGRIAQQSRIRLADITRGRISRGQAMVEFALIATVAIMVLLIGIQFALIGQAALAVSQMSFAGARYASINTCATASDVASYVVYVGSPTVTTSCGTNLTVSLNGSSGSPTCGNGAPTATTGCSTPRVQGTQVQVNISYNATNQLVLPNPFLGISFPTTLTAQETVMSE